MTEIFRDAAFPADLVAGLVDRLLLLGQVDLEAVVGPGAELERTELLVEWEPGDVDLTGGLEYP